MMRGEIAKKKPGKLSSGEGEEMTRRDHEAPREPYGGTQVTFPGPSPGSMAMQVANMT